MEIVVKGRHTEVPDRFRQHVVEKLAKVSKLDHKVISIDVEVSKEHNPRLADHSERIELTIHTRGPVIRAEASADDPYAALDAACAKLEARLRRAADRRRVHHGGKTPASVRSHPAPSADGAGRNGSGPPQEVAAVATLAVGAADEVTDEATDEATDEFPPGSSPTAASLAEDGVVADGPMVIREKVHAASPMTLDQALYEMELVGHDFYLFVDAESRRPSVVYRRRAYDYGVIRLDV